MASSSFKPQQQTVQQRGSPLENGNISNHYRHQKLSVCLVIQRARLCSAVETQKTHHDHLDHRGHLTNKRMLYQAGPTVNDL